MKFIQKMRKRDKGFTLVEIIVVLVILAILAAFTIPSMLGFVNDAKDKANIAVAREIYVAAQATATEYGATTTAPTGPELSSVALNATPIVADSSKQMARYLGDDITISQEDTSTEAVDAKSSDAFWTVTMESGTDANLAKVETVTLIVNGRTLTLTAGGATTIS
jgi:type IV pilus assembly protein PilA